MTHPTKPAILVSLTHGLLVNVCQNERYFMKDILLAIEEEATTSRTKQRAMNAAKSGKKLIVEAKILPR